MLLLVGVGCEPTASIPYEGITVDLPYKDARPIDERLGQLEKQVELIKEYLGVDTYCNGWAYEPYKSPRGVDCELKTANDPIKKEWVELGCDDVSTICGRCPPTCGVEVVKSCRVKKERCKELKQLLNK